MIRVDGWERRLDQAIASGRRSAFQYGGATPHDCLSFPALCIAAVTGVDLFEQFRGCYDDEIGARALVPDIEVFMEELAARLAWPAQESCAARKGDLAAVRFGATFLCAVVYDGLVIPEAPRGLRRFNLRMAEKVWRIG